MKSLNTLFFARCLLVCLGVLSINSVSHARIGESAQTIERRIYSNGGIKYRDDAILSNRKKTIPYLKFMDYMPSGSKVSVFFKTHDGRKPKSSDMEEGGMLAGWDLHVLYVNGKSALELYKRSQAISEFEFNQLLVLQSGSGWQKIKAGPRVEGEEPPVSALGFTMVTNAGTIRASKVGGDAVMFFRADLDILLAETKLQSQQESAPTSVMGF